MTMTGHTPSFLGSPNNTLVSGYSGGQYVRNCLCELEDNSNEEEIEENPPLSTQGDTTLHRAQPETPQSVRRP